MKKILITGIIVICQFAAAFSQTRADDIVGYYLAHTPTAKEKFQVEIFRATNGTYEAKVVWVENPEFRQRLESLQMRNLSFDPRAAEWRNGKMVYDGREYNVTASFTNDGKLRLRGFLGISLFGRTMYWDKEMGLRKN